MKNDNKIIIVGASGYIGKELLRKASSALPILGTTSGTSPGMLSLNLESPEKFDPGIIRPSDVVIFTAAISAPDICSREHARAWAINVTGTSQIITDVMARGGRVIFFSSDTVYGEQREAFDEHAPCAPAGEYAEMKHEVEKRFFGNPLFKAARLSYVFSRDDKFTKYLVGCAERDEEAEIFHPFYRAVVHRDDVVNGALALARRWEEFPEYVINFGGPAVIARTDYAEIMRETVLPGLRFRVMEPAADFFKNRPRVIAMQSPVLPRLLGRPARTLSQAANIELATG